jgi:hypothetical protein
VKVFRELDYPSQIAYLLPADVIESEEGGEEYRKVLAFCRKKKIHMITLSEKTWSPQLQEDLTRQGFQTLILSYTKVGDVLQALDAGADLVASHFYDVSYMKRLLF